MNIIFSFLGEVAFKMYGQHCILLMKMTIMPLHMYVGIPF